MAYPYQVVAVPVHPMFVGAAAQLLEPVSSPLLGVGERVRLLAQQFSFTSITRLNADALGSEQQSTRKGALSLIESAAVCDVPLYSTTLVVAGRPTLTEITMLALLGLRGESQRRSAWEILSESAQRRLRVLNAWCEEGFSEDPQLDRGFYLSSSLLFESLSRVVCDNEDVLETQIALVQGYLLTGAVKHSSMRLV